MRWASGIRLRIEERGFGPWAVEVSVGGAPFVGFIGFHSAAVSVGFTPCVEIGWRLAAEHWGRGYATEGCVRVLAFGSSSLV